MRLRQKSLRKKKRWNSESKQKASLHMMIALSILKWIGIVLGCLVLGILALALLILLVVLFVPFRYRAVVATDETGEKKVVYGFGVYWLAHAISVRKEPETDEIVIRLFGIPIRRMGGESEEKEDFSADDIWEEDFMDETSPPEEPVTAEEPSRITEDLARIADEEVKLSESSADEIGGVRETAIEELEDFSEEENRKEKKEKEKRKTEVESDETRTEEKEHLSPPARFAKAVRDKVDGIKKKIRNTFKKIRFIFYKISSIIDFVKDRASRRTVKKLMKELVAAIRYVGPKKISGSLEFGTGDPGSTGMILCGVSLCRLAYKKDVSIRPNFEEKCLVGDCTVRGRVRVVYFVRMGLRIWFNKDVHHLWRRYRRMKKDFKKQGEALSLDS